MSQSAITFKVLKKNMNKLFSFYVSRGKLSIKPDRASILSSCNLSITFIDMLCDRRALPKLFSISMIN